MQLSVFDIIKEANFSILSRVSTKEMYINRLIIFVSMLNDCFEPPLKSSKSLSKVSFFSQCDTSFGPPIIGFERCKLKFTIH